MHGFQNFFVLKQNSFNAVFHEHLEVQLPVEHNLLLLATELWGGKLRES